jgi:fermentation-respiration switch protein FrsA (DUF1100 family)
MTIIKWLLIIAASGYVVLIALLYVMQRSMLYRPPATHMPRPEVILPEARQVLLDTSDGEKVIVWHVPPRDDKPVVIYFPGNGELIALRAARYRALMADGVGVIAVSYRGYGGSTGTPTEAGLHRDAEAAYAFAAAHYKPDRIVLWGHSLGTGVAVKLASEKPIAKLVLEAPYSSTADVAVARFPYAPVRWLMKDQFHSDQWIGAVKAPILILHGARDGVVPIRFGERLFALAHEPKRFIRYDEGHHNDLDDFGATKAALAFIAEP